MADLTQDVAESHAGAPHQVATNDAQARRARRVLSDPTIHRLSGTTEGQIKGWETRHGRGEGAKPEGQARSRSGGEVGPNGEWYPGGAFIATTDMPKQERQKIDRMAAKDTEAVEIGGPRQKITPGQMPIVRDVGTVLNRDWSVNETYLDKAGYDDDYKTQIRAASARAQKGDRLLDIKEFPALARVSDVVRLIAADQPVPGAALDRAKAVRPDLGKYLVRAKPEMNAYRDKLRAYSLYGTTEGILKGWETRRRGADWTPEEEERQDRLDEPSRLGLNGPLRRFERDEGHEWHEAPERVEWAKGLTADEHDAINSYASFGYGDVNGLLRGTYAPPTTDENVRPATPEEIKAYRHEFFKDSAKDYDDNDPKNKVADGRIVVVPERDAPIDPATGEPQRYQIQRVVPDQKRIDQITTKARLIDDAIRTKGYPLPEDIAVNRAAYIPGLSPESLKAMEGRTIEEKGFSSTMVGNPDRRLDSYVALGKGESIYKRKEAGDKTASDHEVGSAMRIEIRIPAGTKVLPVEPVRRLDYDYPRVQDPAVFDHPEWLTKDDGTPNGLKPEDYTIRDRTQPPIIDDRRTKDKTQRSEAEILVGAGAHYRIVSVKDGGIIHVGDPSNPRVPVMDVVMEYVGGGSSDPS